MIHLCDCCGSVAAPRNHEARCESQGWAGAGSQLVPSNCLLAEGRDGRRHFIDEEVAITEE